MNDFIPRQPALPDSPLDGWERIDQRRLGVIGKPGQPVITDAVKDMRRNYAGTFGTPRGRVVLEHLRALTLERVLPPDASDGEIRYLEGQRAIVKTILLMITAGKEGK